MLTKNFWTIFTGFAGRISGSTKLITMTKIDGSAYSDTIFGTAAKPYTLLGAICLPECSTKYGTWYGTWYGRGRTPATADDYTLEDPITDGSLTGASGSSALITTVANGYMQISAPHSVTNNTNEEITIGEVGCFGMTYSNGSGVLLDRTVLDEPITIPAKGTVAFEYVIKFPFGA